MAAVELDLEFRGRPNLAGPTAACGGQAAEAAAGMRHCWLISMGDHIATTSGVGGGFGGGNRADRSRHVVGDVDGT